MISTVAWPRLDIERYAVVLQNEPSISKNKPRISGAHTFLASTMVTTGRWVSGANLNEKNQNSRNASLDLPCV